VNQHVGLPVGGSTGSSLSHLEGALSGRSYAAGSLIGLDPVDGKPLLARYDLAKAGSAISATSLATRAVGGLWRWRELLPVQSWEFVVHLGEGSTPLAPAHRLGPKLGLSNLLFKQESLNPTGSFKARGMAVAVSRAVELGARHLVAPSAGNAGGALAAYAAAAGVSATVVMPSDSPAVNQTEVLIAGANLILLDGLISDCGRLARLIADRLGAFDLSTLKEPYRVEGKKTMGFEIAEQLGWRLPDVFVGPIASGSMFTKIAKGFAELVDIGLVEPGEIRFVGGQAAGCGPVATAFAEGVDEIRPVRSPDTIVRSLAIGSPADGPYALELARRTGGSIEGIPDDATAAAIRRTASNEGIFIETAGGVTVAAVEAARRRGVIRDGDEVVAILSGNGLKTPDARRFGLGDEGAWLAEAPDAPIPATYSAFSERYG
jgi:threonine synthase